MLNLRLQRLVAGVLLSLLVGLVGIALSTETAEGPAPITFAELCGQYPGVLVESESISVMGIQEPVAIRVINGEYSINGGIYTAEPGMVEFGQRVAVRHTTASGEEASTSTVLIVGGVSATFTSSTGPCLRGTRS